MFWYSRQWDIKQQAPQNMSNTDRVFELYCKTHSDYTLTEPRFSDYYRPSSNQKVGELIYMGGEMFALGYLASRLL